MSLFIIFLEKTNHYKSECIHSKNEKSFHNIKSNKLFSEIIILEEKIEENDSSKKYSDLLYFQQKLHPEYSSYLSQMFIFKKLINSIH